MKNSSLLLVVGALAAMIGFAVLRSMSDSGDNGQNNQSHAPEGGIPRGGIYIHARGSDAVSLDPQTISDGESVKPIQQIFESLMTFKPDSMDVIPCLAEKHEISADNKTFTFHLRKGVLFHDGTPFNADAVKFSLERLTKSSHMPTGKPVSEYSGLYAGIQTIQTPDDHTVIIELSQGDVTFLLNMAMFPVSIVSPTAVKANVDAFGLANPVGTGPFKFKKWDHSDKKITLERFDGYWGEKAYLDKLIFQTVPDNKVRARLLIQGDVDSIDGVSFTDVGELKKASGVKLITQPGMNICYLALNTTKNPAFKDARVRRAVMHAMNRDDLNKAAYAGYGIPALCAYPPSMLGHWTDPQLTKFDLQLAKQLLKDAGYEKGFSFKLNVMTNPRAYIPDPDQLAVTLQQQLAAAGITVNIEKNDWAKHLSLGKNLETEAIIMGWNGDNGDPDNFLRTFFSKDTATPGSASNYSQYLDDEVHQWLNDAIAAQDNAKRAEIYHKIHKKILTDAPLIPIMHTTQVLAMRDRCVNLKLHPLDNLYFKEVGKKK